MKVKPYDEIHMSGSLSIEYPAVTTVDCDFGIQIAADGRVWVCINSEAFIRFKPAPVPTTKEVFKNLAENNKAKKQSNIQKSTQLLIDLDVDFTIHNNGIHLVIEYEAGVIDFWPSTGRWIPRDVSGYQPEERGIFSMLTFMGVDYTL